MKKLTAQDLVQMISSVFPALPGDRSLCILVDFPHEPQDDNQPWKERREVAFEWNQLLQNCKDELKLEEIMLIGYSSVGANNAELPEYSFCLQDQLPQLASDLSNMGSAISLTEVFEKNQLFLAPTEYSTTAPLKMAAPRYQFRAATMPGFSLAMIPALTIDYGIVGKRVDTISQKLTKAIRAEVSMIVDNKDTYNIIFDLRHRQGHASSGRFPKRGVAGNFPSGEAYIVPYEGESEPSQTKGILPVQFGEEVVYYEIENNVAVSVTGEGEAAEKEAALIQKERAYANIAELGFGVLGDFGLDPIGEILLDEKLGFHIAFGRSDHFGGQVSPECFSTPQAVVHIDRIYIPQIQPRILVQYVKLIYSETEQEIMLQDGKFLLKAFEEL